MAEILETHEFPQKQGRKSKHDWSSLLDGKIHKYVQGVDFDSKIETFKMSLDSQARKTAKTEHPIRVLKDQTDDKTLIFQAVPKN